MDTANLNAAETVVLISKVYAETDDPLLGHGGNLDAPDRMAVALCVSQLHDYIHGESYNKKESN